jgi:hypothetical protein
MGVSSLTVFQRTPCWSPPRLDYAYPDSIKTLFALVPFTNTIYRYKKQFSLDYAYPDNIKTLFALVHFTNTIYRYRIQFSLDYAYPDNIKTLYALVPFTNTIYRYRYRIGYSSVKSMPTLTASRHSLHLCPSRTLSTGTGTGYSPHPDSTMPILTASRHSLHLYPSPTLSTGIGYSSV